MYNVNGQYSFEKSELPVLGHLTYKEICGFKNCDKTNGVIEHGKDNKHFLII